MLTFKTFMLAEAGDSPYDYEDEYHNEKSSQYKFKVDKTPYEVKIDRLGKGSAAVTFGVKHDMDPFSLRGDMGTKAGRIMSTIHHIVKRHVMNNPEIKDISFTSDASEPSRVALYTRYTKRLGGYTHDSKHIRDTKLHVIPADSYR